LRERSDSVAAVLAHGQFDLATVSALEAICAEAKTDDINMQSFTTTIEDLFYSHLASFTTYYIANPNSCLREKLKPSMEEYMSAYPPKDRSIKNFEKRERVLKKAKIENPSRKKIGFLRALFDSVTLQ